MNSAKHQDISAPNTAASATVFRLCHRSFHRDGEPNILQINSVTENSSIPVSGLDPEENLWFELKRKVHMHEPKKIQRA